MKFKNGEKVKFEYAGHEVVGSIFGTNTVGEDITYDIFIKDTTTTLRNKGEILERIAESQLSKVE